MRGNAVGYEAARRPTSLRTERIVLALTIAHPKKKAIPLLHVFKIKLKQ